MAELRFTVNARKGSTIEGTIRPPRPISGGRFALDFLDMHGARVAYGVLSSDERAALADDAAPPPPPPAPAAPTTWRAGPPLSDAEAATRVRAASENRPGNADENAYKPSATELQAFRTGQTDRWGRTQLDYNPLSAHVTGGFTGTTDEILQWVAHKWGIPEDIVRAIAVNESNWSMSQLGDRNRVADPTRYPAYSRIAGTSDVYESLGIMQIKWTPEGLHQGTEPLRWKSTAFNVDYWASVVRYYYGGHCDWCGPGYSAGQEWASVGAWYDPSTWVTSSEAYVQSATNHIHQRPWAQPGF